MTLRIYYQGIVCHSCVYNRSLGSGHDTSEVYLHVRDADLRRPIRPKTKQPFFPTADEPADPPPGAGGGRNILDPDQFFHRGTLAVAEEPPDGIERPEPLIVRDLFVSEEGIRIVERDHNEDPAKRIHLCRITLVDVRRFWGRGFLNAAINIKDASGMGFLPATAKTGGAPVTVEEWAGMIIRALPGRGIISRFNETVRQVDATGGNYIGRPPKEGLDDLMTDHGLALSLRTDGSVEFFGPGEKSDRPDPRSFKNADEAPEPFFAYAPEQVLVVGGKTTVTVKIGGWIAVGRNRKGELVALEDALKDYGLSLDVARRFAIMPLAQARLFLKDRGINLPEEEAREVREWAFKWYRLPDADGKLAHLLPIEDRGDVDPQTGERLEPLVEARTYAEIDRELDEVEIDSLPAASDDDVISTISSGGAGLLEPLRGSPATTSPPAGAHVSFSGFRSLFPSFDFFISTTEPPAVDPKDPLAFAGRPAASRKIPPDSAGASAPATTGVKGSRKVFVNVPRAPVANVSIDRDLGLVRFTRPVGWLTDVAAGEATARATVTRGGGGRLKARSIDRATLDGTDAGVVVTFGTDLKLAGFSHPASIDHRYFSAYNVVGATIAPAPEFKKDGFPLLARDDSLELVVDSQGHSNITDLDAKANEIALRAVDDFIGDLVVDAYRVVLGRPHALETDGFLQSLRLAAGDSASWELAGGIATGFDGLGGPAAKRREVDLIRNRRVHEGAIAQGAAPRAPGAAKLRVRQAGGAP